MFKAGDKVVCVDASGTDGRLTKGNVYTFVSMSSFEEECILEEDNASWMLPRFKLYEETKLSFQAGDSLHCIDNKGVEGLLDIAEIYECKGMRSAALVDVEVGRADNYGWSRPTAFDVKRFELVEYAHAQPEESPVWNEAVTYHQGEQVAFPEIEKLFEQAANIEAEQKTIPKNNKYLREIKPGVFVDVYDVLHAFDVTDPCLQHLAKKALCAGLRGHKDRAEDLKDILASAQRAIEMHYEWNPK